MPVPSTMADLFVTSATNNPPGGEIIGTLGNDYHQALQAILRRESAKGADLPITSGILTPGNDGNYIVVTTVGGSLTGIAHSWVGREIRLVFSGAVQVIHSSNLILPGGLNITTSSAAVLTFVEETAAPIWRCVGSSLSVIGQTGPAGPTGPTGPAGPAGPAGSAGVPPGIAFLETRTFTSVANVDFVLTSAELLLYRVFQFLIGPTGVTLSTTGAEIIARFSSNSGASFDVGSGDYTSKRESRSLGDGVAATVSGVTTSFAPITGSNNTGIPVYGRSEFGRRGYLTSETYHVGGSGVSVVKAWCQKVPLADYNAIRFMPSAGTFTGLITKFGVRF